jgi:hypothetical protein
MSGFASMQPREDMVVVGGQPENGLEVGTRGFLSYAAIPPITKTKAVVLTKPE